jgi:hypothetical protein
MEAAWRWSFVASSPGTVIEWYDLYVFGSLTSVLSLKFYPPATIRFPGSLTWRRSLSASSSVPLGALFDGAARNRSVVMAISFSLIATYSDMEH